MPAEVTDEMAPGVVSIPQGWGPAKGQVATAASVGSVSINDLTDDSRIDPVSGNAAFNGVPVTLTPV
jgi:anaerobic selenocysteine-containing dehydrogenase